MIEVYVLETYSLPKEHCLLLQEKLSEGFDIQSNHVTTVRTDGEDFLVYTTYLTRGSRPGQLHKAAQIEIQGLEINALRAELVALQEAFKHQSARIDVILREMQGDTTDEAVPINWLEDYMNNLRALTTKPSQVIPVDSIPVNNAYEEAVDEAITEDEQQAVTKMLNSLGLDAEWVEVDEL